MDRIYMINKIRTRTKFKLWVLIIVALAGAGYFGWYYLMGPGKITNTTTTDKSTNNKSKERS